MAVVVEGAVVRGDRRGRELGFPTANVAVPDDGGLPPDGVFAGVLQRADGTRHLAAISIGRRPQFYAEGERLVEAYVLDFSEDLYGEQVRIEIGAMVRAQARYSTDEELIAQMTRDVEAVRAAAR